jgi:hypothetical protein
LANKSNDRATKRWIKNNCESCPNCSAPIKKAGGCDHMTCAKCKYEFCWLCSADYNNIREDGNHRHEPTCEYYATDLDSNSESESEDD